MTASDWTPTTTESSTVSRASGALLGQCVGDALGCRYQYRSGADVRKQIGADRDNQSGFLPIRGSTVFDFPPGQVGDGTELCMLVARSISREGGVSIPDVLSSLMKWKRSNPMDMNATVFNALEVGSEDENLNFTADELEQNVINNAFRSNMTSLSNVCLTLATPLAIAGVHSTDQTCTDIAARIVKLTQPHPGAIDAVRVLTTAIRSLLIFPDPQMAYKRAFECAKTHLIRDHMMQSRVRPHPQPEDETNLSEEELPIEYLGIALQSAFYYLLHARTFAEGVIGCVELGGDTTTNAAITGALLGARFGLMEIPLEWRTTVQCAKLERHTRFPDVFLGDVDQLVERLLSKLAKAGGVVPMVMYAEIDEDDRVTDWKSIYVASILAFCSAMQYSLYFTSMWPFLEIVDSSATEKFFGLVVAVYSLAQCVASPIFGFWSNRIKQITVPMYAGIGAMILGNIIYFCTEFFPSNRLHYILVARVLIGIGSANVPLLRTYASTSCVAEDRSLAHAYINGGISLGTTLGPGLQLLFSPFGYPGLVFCDGLSINMYTAPAFAACLVNIFCALLLKFCFRETYAGIIEEDCSDDKPRLPDFDKTAVVVCNLTRFTQQFFFTNIELIGSPIAMTVFAFTRQQTIGYGSVAQIALGIACLVNFMAYIILGLSKWIRHRIAILFALGILLIFHLVTYSWPFIPGRLITYSDQDLNNTTKELVGCNEDRYQWCHTMKPLNYLLYYTAFALCTGVAMPYIDISNSTVYGRVLGPRRQGTMQGVMQFCGGTARFVGPMIVALLYASHGPEAIWQVEMALILVTALSWVTFYGRMVELKVQDNEKTTLNGGFGYASYTED